MSGTYTSESGGDWGTAAIWSTDSVPNSSTADVTIAIGTEVTIASGESFVAGSVRIDLILNVAGSLTVANDLNVGNAFGELALSGGDVDAGQITVSDSAVVDGPGTLASSATLTNDGFIYDYGSSANQGFGPGGPLTLAPASYTQSVTGAIEAQSGGTLTLAPTSGAAAFANLSDGTLSGGFYGADFGGTLELPGSLTAIEQATVFLGYSPSTAQIEIGGIPIQAALTTIGTGAQLQLTDYDYVTANTLTLSGGSIELGSHAILYPAALVLADASSELFGYGTVSCDVDNNGIILAEEGVLVLSGTVSGSGNAEIAEGGTLDLVQGGSEAVTFEIGNSYTPPVALGLLQLQDPDNYAGTISGFTAVDVNGRTVSPAIDLPGFAPGTLSDVYNGTTAGGTLDILSSGRTIASLHFVGDYTQDSFTLIPDGTGTFGVPGGTDIALSNILVPCFARGTRIATPAGDAAVEDLRVSDRVLTAEGEARPIVWIGQRRVDCARHPRPWLVHPVRVRAGAFADDVPQRDLLLSPDHALFSDDALIPVQQLINGATIVQDKAARVHYFHIELDRHAIVLAEGLPAESYLDTGNRGQFENGGGPISLFADFSTGEDAHGCAPRLTRCAAVDAVNRRLWQRAVALGTRAKTPVLWVEAAGRTVRAAAVKGRLHRFLLPAGAAEARILAPAGARIGAILVDGRIVPLDSPALGTGFGPLQQAKTGHWRPIGQAARLHLPELSRRQPSVLLEVLLREADRAEGSRRRPTALHHAPRFGAAA